MALPLPHSLGPATARQAYQEYKNRDNQSGDADPRPDSLQWSNGAQKVEVLLTPRGFLARQSEPEQVRVTQCILPRWLGEAQVQTICRTTQGAYTGFLGGVPITPEAGSQESARQVFYQWQKPLYKADDG